MTDAAIGINPASAVDIWLTRLSDIDDDMRRAYKGLLSDAEKARLSRFLVDHASDQFLVARALLRTVLSNHADVPRHAWNFGVNAYGKPHIIATEIRCPLKFNLSHTNGVVACAVSHGHDVGIDIEYIRHDLNYQKLAHYVFAQTEISGLNRLPLSAQRQRFYTLWTLKEAYVKAVGAGLSVPLDEFWFDLDRQPLRIQFASNSIETSTYWHFESLNPTPEHALALAIAAHPDRPVCVNVHWTIPGA